MKSTILGALAVTQAVRIAPDVFGPNGDNYKNDDTAQDMAKIKIDISAPGSGSNCKDTDEATIHYSAYTTDGRIFSDSKQEGGNHVFAVGTGNTWKCLDLAMTQLKPGAKAHLECASNLVYGSFRAKAPLGGEDIPENSDVNFDVEVVTCKDNAHPNLGVINWGDFETVQNFKIGYCYNFKQGDKFLRHNGAEVMSSADSEDTNPESALFKVQKGLNGVKDTISFESLNVYQGYLKNSHGAIRLAVGDNDAYAEDASFKVRQDGPNTVHFESQNPLYPAKSIAVDGEGVSLKSDATAWTVIESLCPGQEQV